MGLFQTFATEVCQDEGCGKRITCTYSIYDVYLSRSRDVDLVFKYHFTAVPALGEYDKLEIEGSGYCAASLFLSS